MLLPVGAGMSDIQVIGSRATKTKEQVESVAQTIESASPPRLQAVSDPRE